MNTNAWIALLAGFSLLGIFPDGYRTLHCSFHNRNTAAFGATDLPQPFSLAKAQPACTVYVFLGTECPLSQSYTLPLNQFHQQFANQPLTLVGVFPAVEDDEHTIKAFVQKYQVKFAVRRDPGQKLARQLKASVTPQAFLINSHGEVLYSGKIDDWVVSLGKKKPVATERYLETAILAYLSGKEIQTRRTEAIGCLIEAPRSHQH